MVSLMGMHATLPLVEDIHMHVADRVPTLRARRSFAEGTLVLVPMVPGHAQIVHDSFHPHRCRFARVNTFCICCPVGRRPGPIVFGRRDAVQAKVNKILRWRRCAIALCIR